MGYIRDRPRGKGLDTLSATPVVPPGGITMSARHIVGDIRPEHSGGPGRDIRARPGSHEGEEFEEAIIWRSRIGTRFAADGRRI